MKEKKALLEKLSKLLKNNRKESKQQDEVTTILENQIAKLETIDDKETTSTIEFLQTGKTSYNAFLWQERLVAQYHFFVTALGYMDGVLDELGRNKKLLSFFDGEEEMITAIEKERLKFLGKRQNMVEDYKETTSENELYLVIEVLEKYPSYQQFANIYADLAENHYQLNLQNELIIAYNNGYIASTKMEPTTFLETYHNLYQELSTHKKNNQNKKNQVQERIKLKK